MPSSLVQDAAALRSRATLLEVEVNDKKQIIETLKRALTESKEQERKALQEQTKEGEERLLQQKAHYEAGLERHLRLVDRLLNDKTELTKRCEILAEELKAVERKFQLKMEELQEQSSKELARQKQNWTAAERLRREAWEKEKLREIKEMTVKGLQPEVERILSERKQEKLRLEDRHREVVEEIRREMHDQGQAQVRQVRDSLLRQQEEALDRERESHRRKLREEFERFSRELQDERAKCAADLLAERRQREELLRQGAEQAEKKLKETVTAERAKVESALEDARQQLSLSEDRHRQDLASLEASLREGFLQAKHELSERFREELRSREAALRAELVVERDQQIEVLLERVSRDHVEQQRQLKEEGSAQVERVRSEIGAEQLRLGAQLQEARAEIASLQGQCRRLEATNSELRENFEATASRLTQAQVLVQSVEEDKALARKALDQAQEQHRDELWRVAEIHRKELETLRIEIRALETRLREEQVKLDAEKEEAKRKEEEIISSLEARVKRAVQAKDEMISELQLRCAAADNKVKEFEYLLARQREELLGSITRVIRP